MIFFWGEGYRQTIVTRHAPTVRSKTEAFDFELWHLFKEQNLTPGSSREVAISKLQKIVADLQSKPNSPSGYS